MFKKRSVRKSAALIMTEGSPYKLLLSFALPLLFGNVLQQMYNLVDSMVVGNFIGHEALAAVGAVNPLFFLFVSLFVGIAIGATVLIAQFFGADNKERVQDVVDTVYKTFIVTSLVFTAVGLLLMPQFMDLLGIEEALRPMSSTYLSIIFIGFLPLFGYNINNGILQGVGDTVSSLRYLAIATVVNIVLDLLFVGPLGWGIAGAAWATVIAQTTSFLFGIWHINRRKGVFQITLWNKNFDGKLLKSAVKLGMPAGIQNILFSLGMLAVVRLINSYGAAFMAGNNAGNKIDSLAFLPMTSYASAITSYVGQNIGAGKFDRVKEGVKAVMVIMLVTSLILIPIVMIFGPDMLSWFIKEYDPAVIDAGMAYLTRVVPFLWMLGMMFMLTGALRGAGSAIIPMVTSLLSLWLMRIPLAYFLAHNFGKENLYYAWPLGWLLGLMISGGYFLSGRWKKKAMLLYEEQQADKDLRQAELSEIVVNEEEKL